MVNFWTVVAMVFATFVGAIGSVHMKKGSVKLKAKTWAFIGNFNIFLGITLYGLSTVIYIFLLKFEDLSALYPLVALSYVWVLFLSVKFLNEKMNKFKSIGVLLIIIGIILITAV